MVDKGKSPTCPCLEDMGVHLRDKRGPHTSDNGPRGQASSTMPEQGLPRMPGRMCTGKWQQRLQPQAGLVTLGGHSGLRLGQHTDKIRGLLGEGRVGSPSTLQTWASLYCRSFMVLFFYSRMTEKRKVSGKRGLAPPQGHPHRRDCRRKALERDPGVCPPPDPKGT